MESRSLQIERSHSSLQDDFFPLITPFMRHLGHCSHTVDSFHTTAFPLLSSPFSSAQVSRWQYPKELCFQGVPTLALGQLLESQRVLSCLGDRLVQAASPGHGASLTHPGAALLWNTWTAYSPFLVLTTTAVPGRVPAPSPTLDYIQTPSKVLIL